jgi:mono/diheme cytochrome c family protein
VKHLRKHLAGTAHDSARCILLLMVWAGGLCGVVAGETNTLPTPSLSTILQGRAVYQKNCVFCHGLTGDGRGEMGLGVQPRPRDFRTGVFKFRSTPSGFLPTENDLARTIRQGLTGTAMPTFAALREHEVQAVVEYVKTFSPRWMKSENHAPAMKIPAPPAWFSNAAARPPRLVQGRQLFQAACAACHGASGDGRGPTAPTLKDSDGETIAPSDLRQPLRAGTGPEDIYRLLVTGMDGTPMPSFHGSFSEAQLWEIVAYVLDLRRAEDDREK